MKKLFLYYLCFVALFFTFSLNVKAAEDTKDCIILMGDSRCFIMQNAARTDSGTTIFYDRIDFTTQRGYIIFETDQYYIIFSSKSGGSLVNGDADLCMGYINDALTHLDCSKINRYTFFNLYGVNDMPYMHDEGLLPIDLLDIYNEKNLSFKKEFSFDCEYYQSTIGRINDDGTIVETYTNYDISRFNQKLLQHSKLKVYDLASFIKNANLNCMITEFDPCGVHYSIQDSILIFHDIISFTSNIE